MTAGFPLRRLVVPASPRHGLRNAPALASWQGVLLNWLRPARSKNWPLPSNACWMTRPLLLAWGPLFSKILSKIEVGSKPPALS